jgi:hypothetical protein
MRKERKSAESSKQEINLYVPFSTTANIDMKWETITILTLLKDNKV